MKARIIRIISLVCLMAVMLTGMQVAYAADDNSRVDAVIIVDISTSMNQNESSRKQNIAGQKIYDAAYDAATMFIQMCEMNGSRVAVVPFARGVYPTHPQTGDYEWNVLRSISDLNVRNELVDKIRALRSDNNTDLGPAMQIAYELLEGSRGDAEANKPMILLLTDGYIEIFANGSKLQEETKASEAQAEEYARLSREAGINIYCIGLESENYNGDNLKTYTNDPEKVYKTDEVTELPRIFNEIFADQIGARVIDDIEWTENEDGTVTLDIRIPNRSILEANVILSMAEGADKPDVYDPQGQYANGADNVQLFGGMSYQIVKIQNPEVGTYKITYEPEDVNAIKVSLVANYKVQYQLEGVTTADKNSTVTINGYFTENGQHTGDTALYTGNITANLKVYDASGSVVAAYPMMTADTQDHFTCEVPLTMTSGDYYLVSEASGDGLARSSQEDYKITVVNYAPEAVSQPEKVSMLINNVLTDDPYATQYAEPIDLSRFFTERNINDALRYEAGSVRVATTRIDGSTLYVESNGNAGNEKLVITAYDQEGQSSQVEVEIDVFDVRAALQSGRLVVEPTLTASEQGKSQDVNVYVRMYDNNGQMMTDADMLNTFASGAQLVWKRADEKENHELTVAYDEDTDSMKGVISTTNKAGEYQISGSVQVHDAQIPLEDFAFAVNNSEPKAVVFVETVKLYIEELPIPIPNQPTRLSADLNMSEYFTDADGEALSYRYECASTVDEEGNELVTLPAEIENGILKIEGLNDGKLQVQVFAEDGDGAQALVTFDVVIVSITDETIKLAVKWILIAIAAFVIAKVFYYVVLKPKYQAKMKFSITRSDSYIDEKKLPTGKKTVRLSAYHSSDATDGTGINKGMLSNITIKPGQGGSLVVTNGKKNKTKGPKQLIVTVGGKTVKPGKSERLYENGSIALKMTDHADDGIEPETVAWTYEKKLSD